MDIIQSIANAIAKQEGAKASLNNPGNIMDLDYYKSTGNFKLKQYSSMQEGWDALYSLIGNYINSGVNLYQFFQKYAPSGHGSNNPTVYANNVAKWTGIDPNKPLNSIDPNTQQDLNSTTGTVGSNTIDTIKNSFSAIGDYFGGGYVDSSTGTISELPTNNIPSILMAVGLGLFGLLIVNKIVNN